MGDKRVDIKRIMAAMPHRYPFLMVDRVIDYEEGKWLKAIKNVTNNEPFFTGHFPDEPIMPGVLIVEALAQTGGLLSFIGQENQSKLAIFMTINNVKFRKPVIPGDQLELYVTLTKMLRKNVAQVHGVASVDGQAVTERVILCSVFLKKDSLIRNKSFL